MMCKTKLTCGIKHNRNVFLCLLVLSLILLFISFNIQWNRIYMTVSISSKSDLTVKNIDQSKTKPELKAVAEQKAKTKPKSPHIVLIVADDLGFNDVGYHNKRVISPTLDSLARNGVIMENYYVQPICSPTRSQLLSGRYQIHTGLQHGIIQSTTTQGVPVNMPMISNKLRDAGYATHAVGKWHVGIARRQYWPTYRGFDTFFGFLGGYEDHYKRSYCLRNFCGRDFRNNTEKIPIEQDTGEYSTNIYANKAIDIIENHDSTKTQIQDMPEARLREVMLELVEVHPSLVLDLLEPTPRQPGGYHPSGDGTAPDWCVCGHCRQMPTEMEKVCCQLDNCLSLLPPMFLYLAFAAVHGPLQVPVKYKQLYKNDKGARQTYLGMVTCLDEAIANVTNSLKATGMWNDTVLVFTTDNGGSWHNGGSNIPLRKGKGSLFEGGIRAVGFVTSPLLHPKVKGSVSRELIHVTDWFPTFMELAKTNTSQQDNLDGFSQWQTINGLRTSARSEMLINIDTKIRYDKPIFNDTFDSSIKAAIRVGKWKLLTGQHPAHYKKDNDISKKKFKNTYLFDITKDPRENRDQSANRPDIVKQLLDKLQTYHTTSVPHQNNQYDPRCKPRLHGGFWDAWL